MSKKEQTEAMIRQRFSGKIIVASSLFVVALYTIAETSANFHGFPFEDALIRTADFCLASLILMSPSFLAALWQFFVKPGWASSIICRLGHAWMLLMACLGMKPLWVITSFG